MIRAAALLGQRADLPLVRLAAALGETTAVTIAPPGDDSERLLADARAAGAARCLRLWDEAMPETDYLGLAFALAATLRTALGELASPPTVIVCGSGGRGAVGPALAERLGLPHLGEVVGAQLVESRVVARRSANGVVRLYAGTPPLVLCAAPDAAAPPEAPSDAAAWTSAVGESEVWTLQKIGLTSAELAYRKRFRPRSADGPVARPMVFTDAAALVARLRADGLLPGGG